MKARAFLSLEGKTPTRSRWSNACGGRWRTRSA